MISRWINCFKNDHALPCGTADISDTPKLSCVYKVAYKPKFSIPSTRTTISLSVFSKMFNNFLFVVNVRTCLRKSA